MQCNSQDVTVTNDVIVDENKNDTIRGNEKVVITDVYDAVTLGGSDTSLKSQNTEDLFDKDSDDDNNSNSNENANSNNDDNCL